MRKLYLILFILGAMVTFGSCDFLDTRIDTSITPEDLDSDYTKLRDLGYTPYTYIGNGFEVIDSNISAAVSDEAEQTAAYSNAQKINNGSWDAYSNPLDVYRRNYTGIRGANFFLEYSTDYKTKLAQNRDTLSDRGLSYRRDVEDIEWLRAEAHILKAYFYFDLIKRYGDVPWVDKVLSDAEEAKLPRTDFNTIVGHIVSAIDQQKDNLQPDWNVQDVSRDGRITKGIALALKSRILLYAASPLHNQSPEKWEQAAKAAYDVIELNQYRLSDNYRNLFLKGQAATDKEVIWSIRYGSSNGLERKNYPIGIPGGNSGVTPSHNLVSAYEYKGTPNPDNPYLNRDPRLEASVVVNNSTWNGVPIQMWPGADFSYEQINSSRTGYYLKKFLVDNLDLVHDAKEVHHWIMFRYAEILLNYAEAMNEAYGPDDNNGYSLTAREAVNLIRSRASVGMAPVDVATGDQSEMRKKIKHERRIELAFEDHRYWDLIRWKDAETELNKPLKGVRAAKVTEDVYSYTEFDVEKRVFVSPKMYYFPIPYSEIQISKGILKQNPDW